MKAEELKIGNFVTIGDSNEYVKVEDIISSKNEVNLLFKDGKHITENLDNVYPIELTEEIVNNAGIYTYHGEVIYQSEIETYNKEGWPLPYKQNPFDYIFDIDYGRVKYYYGDFKFLPMHSDYNGIRFKYMHEFQNILFHIYNNITRIYSEYTDKSHYEYHKKHGYEVIDRFDLWKQSK